MTGHCYALEGISFAYHEGEPVIRDLSLALPAGGVTAILGPNGIGKTTFLHLALGWLTPAAGLVRLYQKPLGEYTRRELGQAVSLVPQSEHIAFDYSVLEYVLLGRAPYLKPLALPGPRDVEAAERALEEVGIGALADNPVKELSGGEAQMMLIARSLAQEPRVVLMDEPVSHLDIRNRAALFSLIRGLAARGVSVIFTSHEPDEAFAAADYTVLVGRDREIMAGPPEEIMTAANLKRIYGLDIQVSRSGGNTHFIWYKK